MRFEKSVLFITAFLGLVTCAQAGLISFSGQFDPSLATVVTNGGNGYFDSSGAPGAVTIWGSDSGSDSYIRTFVYWTITSSVSDLSFNWDYLTYDEDGPYYDPAGYCIDDSCIQITDNGGNNSQSGTVGGLNLQAGHTFGFYVDTSDDIMGAARITITGEAVPEPTTLGLMAASLAALLVFRRKISGFGR